MATVITPEIRERVTELCRQEMSRNDIARLVGIAAGSVSKIVKTAGLSFDRTAVQAATEARKTDLAARRAILAEKLLDKADHFLGDLDKPFLAFAFGGKDNDYNEHELDRPPTGDIKNLMQSFGIAITSHVKLIDVDATDGSTEAKSMLAGLAAALGVAGPAHDST